MVPYLPGVEKSWMFSQVPAALELEKFVEDVKNGVYPILSRVTKSNPQPSRPRAVSPDQEAASEKSETQEHSDTEPRSIVSMECLIERGADAQTPQMTLTLKLEDKMNRQLTIDLSQADSATTLTEELVKYALINVKDKDRVAAIIQEEQVKFEIKESQVQNATAEVTLNPVAAV